MTNGQGPKVQGLNGFGLEVPDLDVAQAFYSTFGLAPERNGEVLKLRSPGRANHEAVIVKGRDKRLHHVSFAITPGSEQAFAEKLKAMGVQVQEKAPAGGERAGLWLQDPWGAWINLAPVAPQPVPLQPVPEYNLGGRGGRVDQHLWHGLNRDPKPLRLGHMLMFTPDFPKAEAWYTEALGLRTTDRAAGKVAFMAAGTGTIDHHCFGLIPGTHRGFQHASFQMSTLDDIGFGAWRMVKAGYKETFGLGRHALASNLFHYIRDPWGSWVEYYADMDKVTDQWETREWNELPYIWGPEWSPEFWGKRMNGNFEPA